MPTSTRRHSAHSQNISNSATENSVASIPNQIPGKSYTNVLVILLIIAAFLLGMLTTKVQYLEKQKDTGSTTGATTNAQNNQPTSSQPQSVSNDDIKRWAKEIGLNTQKFNQCFDNKEPKSRVDKDSADGSKAGVSGTPSFFINGTLLVGAQPFDSFKSAIDKEISQSSKSWLALADKANAQTPGAKVNVEKGNLPPLGNPNAPVVIIEFSDFECPYCNRFFKETLPQIKKEYIDTGKVVLYYRHYPLPFHPSATPMAIASECANDQGKFWEMHDKMFKEQ